MLHASRKGLPKKGGGAPKGAMVTSRTTPANVAIHRCIGRGSGFIGSRAPPGAPPRTRFGESTPPLSSSRASWATSRLREDYFPQAEDLAPWGVTPSCLSQSSELLADRSLIPAGRCPEPPGSGCIVRPQAPHSLHFRKYPRERSLRERDGGGCNYIGDGCQEWSLKKRHAKPEPISALPPKADIAKHQRHVRFGPKPDNFCHFSIY